MKFLLSLILMIPGVLWGQASITTLDSFIQAQEFSGVLMVAIKGTPVYHKAFGYRDYAKKIPLKSSDIFELASLSKSFTAMIIMMLKEKSALNYEDPVEKYLEIPYKGITIRHLLTHTGGLPDYQDLMDKHWNKTKVAGNKEIIEYLNRYAPPALFSAGEKYDYSNTGYILLASIAEKASGKDFISLCRKWIFKPLKMRSTDIRTGQQKAATKNFAKGHIYIPGKQQYVRADSFPSSDYTIWLGNRKGPGRISSTTSDLLKWDKALYRERLVKKQTLHEAFLSAKLGSDSLSHYGFGWMLSLHPLWGKVVMHTGDNPGYANQIIRYIDRGNTIIILSNNAYLRGRDEMIRRAENLFFQGN